jgi:large subunit ribosomal protein L7/L12
MADEDTQNQQDQTQQEETQESQEEAQEQSQEGGEEQAESQEQGGEEQSTETESSDASGDSDEDSDEQAGEESTEVESADDAGADVEIPEKFQNIVSEIESMSVLNLNELVKLLEQKFGVSAVAAAAPAGGGGDAGGGEEEKSSYTVELTDVGEEKIGVIKIVKNVLGLGLKEAKDMAENLPATLKEDMPKEDAEDLKSQVEEAGGSIELT